MKKIKKVLDGNGAVAEALRQINPDVFGFYPITPTSYIGEKFAKFVADKNVDTEFVTAESEHAAASVCLGAASAGARAVTATASQGLVFMSEVLFNASGLRLPFLIVNGNRALGAPLSIHCGHDDIMALRDSGCIQFFARNSQEAYEMTLKAFAIMQHQEVSLPMILCIDGFHTTHTRGNVEIFSDELVQKFAKKYQLESPTSATNSLLNLENPITIGAYTGPSDYMEAKFTQNEALENTLKISRKIEQEFADHFFTEKFEAIEINKTANSEIALVALGSVNDTLLLTQEILAKKGLNTTIVRPRFFRPFPTTELFDALQKFCMSKSGTARIFVFDRMSPCGATLGALGSEISNLFINSEFTPQIQNIIYGLGSREANEFDLAECIENFVKTPASDMGKKSDKNPYWLNLKK